MRLIKYTQSNMHSLTAKLSAASADISTEMADDVKAAHQKAVDERTIAREYMKVRFPLLPFIDIPYFSTSKLRSDSVKKEDTFIIPYPIHYNGQIGKFRGIGWEVGMLFRALELMAHVPKYAAEYKEYQLPMPTDVEVLQDWARIYIDDPLVSPYSYEALPEGLTGFDLTTQFANMGKGSRHLPLVFADLPIDIVREYIPDYDLPYLPSVLLRGHAQLFAAAKLGWVPAEPLTYIKLPNYLSTGLQLRNWELIKLMGGFDSGSS